jgi:hypothetical protein
MHGEFVIHGSDTDNVWLTDSHPVRYEGSGDWFAWSEALVPATCSSRRTQIVYNVVLRDRPGYDRARPGYDTDPTHPDEALDTESTPALLVGSFDCLPWGHGRPELDSLMPFFGSSRVRASLSAMRTGADDLRGLPVDIWTDEFRVDIGGRALTLNRRVGGQPQDIIFCSFDPPALPMRETSEASEAGDVTFPADPWAGNDPPWDDGPDVGNPDIGGPDIGGPDRPWPLFREGRDWAGTSVGSRSDSVPSSATPFGP